MDYTQLASFRLKLYQCFQRASDALMNAADALMTHTSAHSFIELSFSPCFQRCWCSLYEAFQDGRIKPAALQKLFASYAPDPSQGQRRILAVDSSNIPRSESKTLKDRTYQQVHNLPKCKSAVTTGWSFSTLIQLPEEPGSGTYILDNRRIPSEKTPSQLAAEQIQSAVLLLKERPILVGDRFYGSAEFVGLLEGVACDGLLRIQSHRVFYRPAPQRTGKKGAPKKDGVLFKCNDPATHGAPDQEWSGPDQTGRLVELAVWEHLHFKKCRRVELCVVRVTHHGASETKRDPRVSWFLWTGKEPPLSRILEIYRLRFSVEHGYRFDKQNLLWCDPRLGSPEQFQLWTDVVSTVHNQLVLARFCDPGKLLPWESRHRKPTLQQVRRAMAGILVRLGSPARECKPCGKSRGWQTGRPRQRKKPCPVLKKGARAPNSGQKQVA